MATYTSTQLSSIVTFIGKYNGNLIGRESEASVGPSFFAAWREDNSPVSKLTVRRGIDHEDLFGFNPFPFLPSVAVGGSLSTYKTLDSLDS